MEDKIQERLEAMYFSANRVCNLNTGVWEDPIELEEALKIHLPAVMKIIKEGK